MKILVISPLLPYPLRDGGRKGIYYPLKFLANRGHDIHFVCLSEELNKTYIQEINKYAKLNVLPHSKKRTLFGFLKSLFQKKPYLLSRFHNKKLLNIINNLLKENFDIIVIEGLHMAYYGLKVRNKINTPIVLRLHNTESTIVKRYADSQNNTFIKTYAMIEYNKMRKYERENCHYFDKVILVSKKDEEQLKEINPYINSSVIPAGVDPLFLEDIDISQEYNSILWVGTLDWLPNQDSFWWFYNEYLPLLIKKYPDIKIYVVGSNPPDNILNIQHPNVDIIGYIDDVRPYFKKSKVCIVPLRIGGGIRLKILEMFAMKKAVVSTSIGCEGLGVKHNQHLLIADNPEDFVNFIIELLINDELYNRIVKNAFEFVLTNYKWENITEKFEKLYIDLIKQK